MSEVDHSAVKGELKLRLAGLDCANCAAKMERAINEMPEIKKATVNFMMQKMTLELEEGQVMDEVLPRVQKVMKKVEPDCRILL